MVWGAPVELIRAALLASDGNELAPGRIDSPRSSAALVLNVFSPFFGDNVTAERLPPLPGTQHLAWPAIGVTPEAKLPFPWAGGRRPNLDVAIELPHALIGIEAKRREPFDPRKIRDWQEAYKKHEWGARMQRYFAFVADPARLEAYRHLAVEQLVRHALGLITAVRTTPDRTPVLFYLYAEPSSVDPAKRALHTEEVARFSAAVEGDAVEFRSATYSEVLSAWSKSDVGQLRAHASAMAVMFDDI